MTRRRRDPHLPAEGDYPTGPIDFGNADDPVVREILADVTVDANDAHHSRANGRFVSKRVDYAHLVEHPDVPGLDRPYTWEEYEALPKGPETAFDGSPSVTVYTAPNHPDVDPDVRRPQEFAESPGVGLDFVAVCCPECVYGPAPKVEPRTPLNGRKASGKARCIYVKRSDRTQQCPEVTDYTDSKGRPACHGHGGTPS